MHAAGLHSALAIKRQRKRRDDQKRAQQRRYSLQSTDSGLTSPRGSGASLERAGRRRPRRSARPAALDGAVSSVGMMHVGVVFLVLGAFLVGSGLLPDDLTSWSSVGSTGPWNELVCTGLFSVGVGLFLVALDRESSAAAAMIGAMPAVAVRHERRRHEKRTKRPSQLYLGGPWLPPSPNPSPSPQDGPPEYYLFGKVSALHAVVGSLLLGGVVLVVGLVQLSPGAEAAQHRHYLLAAGAALVCLGLLLAALRCFCIHCHAKGAGAAGAGAGAVGAAVLAAARRAPDAAPRAVSSIEGLVASAAERPDTPPSEADAFAAPRPR